MKIAIFTDTFLPQINGIVTSIINFSKGLSKNGHEIYIFTPKHKEEKNYDFYKNVHIIYFNSTNFLIKYPELKLASPNVLKTIKILKKIKPDIIHTQSPSLHSIIGTLYARIFKIPIITTYHTLLPDFLKHTSLKRMGETKAMIKTTWKFTSLYNNRLNLVITPSKTMKKELIKHGTKNRVLVVSNGFDNKIFYPSKINHKGIKLLHVGRISYEKNIDVILKSIKETLKEYPKIKLDIVGGGPDLNNLKKLSKELVLDKNVKFLGPMKHEKLRGVYSSHDIFITASTIETEGLVILEAMACGLPIIGVNKFAVPEIVKNNINGFIARPDDIKQISSDIIKLINNKNLREKFGRESIKISKKYIVTKSVKKLEKIYFSLLT